MIVRAVQIDEAVAEVLEHGERRRAAVDELAVRARGGKDALQDQLAAFARLDAELLELRIQRLRIAELKDRLDRAALRAGADQRLVRALAEDELERADDDRFARTRLAGHGDEAGRERPFEFLDEREVADAEGGEGGGHG